MQTSTEYMVLNMSHITKIHEYSDVHCNKQPAHVLKVVLTVI